ncbi:MAG TPA: hypothetical protein VMX13_02115 [Sedimentisphaerales bacterium]|nr:hypothetical protein [Sedimentisphaerales bacterium]
MKPLVWKIFIGSIAILTGALSFWMVSTNSTWAVRKGEALCILELQGGIPNVSASFTTSETLEQFFVAARPEARGEWLSLTITGEKGLLCSFSAITNPMRFSFSPGEIPPGTYEAVLKQEVGSQGGRVVIAAGEVGLTGWQIWSRAFVGLLLVSGVWAGVSRKSTNRRRATSSFMFHSLLLAFVMIFLYLLFHEGGHALGASIFGQCDWARSDFWGIHGTPHSGLKAGIPVEPWQRAIVSFAGPMLPTLMGWALFLLWRSRTGRQMRSRHPMVNVYLSAIVAMFVLPFVAVLGCLLGIISDGDWLGFIENVPGPLWLVKALVCIVLLVNGFILWRIGPELWRVWKAKVKAMVRQSGSSEMTGRR